MGEQYLIDTNIVISYLDGKISTQGTSFMDSVVDTVPNISVITKIELLGFNASDQVFALLNEFINASILFELTDEIVNKTIALRRTYKIKIPDAIIAATALVFNLILITRNKADFKKIRELEVIDPHEL